MPSFRRFYIFLHTRVKYLLRWSSRIQRLYWALRAEYLLKITHRGRIDYYCPAIWLFSKQGNKQTNLNQMGEKMCQTRFELLHDKTNNQTDLCDQWRIRSDHIRPVWSEPSLWAQWVQCSYWLNFSLCGQRIPWSDWADAQAYLSLRWDHRSFCWFCHAMVHIVRGL